MEAVRSLVREQRQALGRLRVAQLVVVGARDVAEWWFGGLPCRELG